VIAREDEDQAASKPRPQPGIEPAAGRNSLLLQVCELDAVLEQELRPPPWKLGCERGGHPSPEIGFRARTVHP
jgi:hypothetical protein